MASLTCAIKSHNLWTINTSDAGWHTGTAVVGGSLHQPLIPPLSVALSLAITGRQPSIDKEETSLHVGNVATYFMGPGGPVLAKEGVS